MRRPVAGPRRVARTLRVWTDKGEGARTGSAGRPCVRPDLNRDAPCVEHQHLKLARLPFRHGRRIDNLSQLCHGGRCTGSLHPPPEGSHAHHQARHHRGHRLVRLHLPHGSCGTGDDALPQLSPWSRRPGSSRTIRLTRAEPQPCAAAIGTGAYLLLLPAESTPGRALHPAISCPLAWPASGPQLPGQESNLCGWGQGPVWMPATTR